MSNLTEQWKKGNLPEGNYYVRDGGNIIAQYFDGYFYNDGLPMTSFYGGVDEVLAEVPMVSYIRKDNLGLLYKGVPRRIYRGGRTQSLGKVGNKQETQMGMEW